MRGEGVRGLRGPGREGARGLRGARGVGREGVRGLRGLRGARPMPLTTLTPSLRPRGVKSRGDL